MKILSFKSKNRKINGDSKYEVNKPRKVALIILVVAVIGLTVASAALSSNLTISGNAKLDPINWSIYFDNISGVDLSGEAAIVDNPEIDSNDKTKITNFNVTLKKTRR